jgi:hypothetical protein
MQKKAARFNWGGFDVSKLQNEPDNIQEKSPPESGDFFYRSVPT